MIRLLALLTTQAPCFGWIVHSDSYNGDDLMAYEMTIPFLGIPSSTWRTWPLFCKRGSCSGVLGGGRPMSILLLVLRGLHVVAVSSPPVSCTLGARSFRPRRLAHNTTGPGPRFPQLFLFPLHRPTCRFLLSIQKEKKRCGGFAAERAVPNPRFWLSFFVHVCGGGERERVRKTWAYRIAIFTLCVLSVLCLVDGLHIPIVTSLRRLSTVGCGGMGERIVSKKKTDGPCQSWEAGGTAERIDTSARDYYYHLSGQGRHFGIATAVVRILRRRTGRSKMGWGGGVVLLFDLSPCLWLLVEAAEEGLEV